MRLHYREQSQALHVSGFDLFELKYRNTEVISVKTVLCPAVRHVPRNVKHPS